jgi:hypothetical protein
MGQHTTDVLSLARRQRSVSSDLDPTIDDDSLTGYVASSVRGHEYHQVRNIGRVADPAHGDVSCSAPQPGCRHLPPQRRACRRVKKQPLSRDQCRFGCQ